MRFLIENRPTTPTQLASTIPILQQPQSVAIDTQTGLVWQRWTTFLPIADHSKIPVLLSLYNDNMWGGYMDWRVPTITEFHSLYTRKDALLVAGEDGTQKLLTYPKRTKAEQKAYLENRDPWIDTQTFPKGAYVYWSSTAYFLRANTENWVIDFVAGTDYARQRSIPYGLWCVRGLFTPMI